jgi:hypothetical protein
VKLEHDDVQTWACNKLILDKNPVYTEALPSIEFALGNRGLVVTCSSCVATVQTNDHLFPTRCSVHALVGCSWVQGFMLSLAT